MESVQQTNLSSTGQYYRRFDYHVDDVGNFDVLVTIELDSEAVIDASYEAPQIVAITHEQLLPYESPINGDWNKGHEWIVPGYSTKVDAAFEYEGGGGHCRIHCGV